MEGFYAAYLTGSSGMSIALLVIHGGKLTGVDVGGVNYDGVFTSPEHDSGHLCSLKYTVPKDAVLITGASVSEEMSFTTDFILPRNFSVSGVVVTIPTPTGPVNARFEKLRELDRG